MKNNNHLLKIHQETDDEIDLVELVNTVINGKWLIIFLAITAFVISYLYAHSLSSSYKADSLLRVESQKSTIPNIEELASWNRDENVAGTEIEMIKSRKVLGKAVEDLKLDIIAQPKKLRHFSNLFNRFFSSSDTQKPPSLWGNFDKWSNKYAWSNEKITVDQLNLPPEWKDTSLTLISKHNDNFILKYEDDVLLTGTVGRISHSEDRSMSILISTLIGTPGTEFTVSKTSKRIAIQSLQNRIQIEEKGLKNYYTGMVSLSLTGSDENKIKNILDTVATTYVDINKSRVAEEATNALKFLEEQLKPVKKQLLEAEANLSHYRVENQTANLSYETNSVLNAIVDIDTELQKFSFSKNQIQQRFTPDHPKIQTIESQEYQLKRKKQENQKKIAKLPLAQQTLFRLERDINVSNSMYIDLLNKIQEFKIAEASTIGNASIVDRAEIDGSFIPHNKRMIMALGLLLGAMLGIGIIFLRHAFRQTIDNPEKLEQSLGVPVFATIPLTKKVKLSGNFNSKNRKQKTILALDHPSDPAIEGLRSLRTTLHFALHEAKNNIVMFTGSSPFIGKSFISSNFSAISAMAGQRVLIIDADMRKGYLHELTNTKVTPGLSELITEKAELEDTLQIIKVGDNYLDLITCGQKPPNPSELLMHDKFSKILETLSVLYDLIIIDSPPIHAVTDPIILANHVGVVFMVVRAGKESTKEVGHAISKLTLNNIETKGVILNGYVPEKSKYGYGSYYGEYKESY